MKKAKKKVLIVAAIVSLVAVFSVVVYAAILRTYTRGEIEVSSTTVDIETTYSIEGNNYTWTYTEAGDSKDINVTVENNCEMNIHRYYKVEVNTNLDNNLASAIMVYYNNKFVDTLLNLDNNLSDHDIDDNYALLATGSSATDTIRFELHQAASNSVFNDKTIKVTLTTFSENVDYSYYQLVKTKDDFDKIMTDINSGLLSVIPTIVLANSITLTKSYNVICPLTIQTNGFNLSGSLTINDNETTNPDALLTVLGSGNVGASVGTYYNKTGARELVANYAKEVLKYGIKAGTIPEVKNIIGPYSFYGLTVAVTGLASFTTPNITGATTLPYTRQETITFTGNGSTEITYKHIGTKNSFDEENILMHMPSAGQIVTNDLFLPTFVPGCNASIIWNSSNEGVMSNNGDIVNDINERAPITLTARIKVNDTVYTRSYSFYITSNNNQVNFQKLVKDISPLIIKKKYEVSDANNTTYCLPIVTNAVAGVFGTYDYRTDFTSPTSEPTFSWSAHDNINLVSLTYSKYYDGTEQNPIDTYDYIGVSQNQVRLINDTLSNYAKIVITGEFDNGEIYSANINISIAVGSDTELLEKAFNNVDNALDDISVLGNILSTRMSSGMLSEKGDFYLPATFGESYTLAYEVADTSNIISCGLTPVTVAGKSVYKFTVDPTRFNSVETAIPVRATVTYHKTDGSTLVKTKIIYIDTPAAIHVSDLGNISIFNSLKYQVINSLPSSEKVDTGFSGNDLCTNTGYDYILLRDVVGDEYYIQNYTDDTLYLTMNGYLATGSDGTLGLNTIKLYTANTNYTSTTDTLAYDFIKLISWATGNTKTLASSVLSTGGQAKLNSTLLTYKSNGETYLTENELLVLETFYKACTNDDGTLWNQIKSLTLETAPGRIYDNADLLVTILRCLTNEKGVNSSWYENNGNGTYGKIYAKYLEVINRYAITTSENEELMSPAQEVYNSKFYYSFTTTAQNSTSVSATTAVSFPCKYYDASGNLVDGYCNRYGENNWRNGGSGTRQGTYAASSKTGNAAVDLYANQSGYPYDSDHTKYITSAELMVLKAFWLGSLGTKTEQASNNVTRQFTSDSITLITEALAADENGILPYPEYRISDFTYYGQAILNAFDACLTIPTYFTSNGIGLLINSFYDNFNTTGYKLRDYNNSNDTTSFVSKLISGVPAVTNLDNLEGALSFFSKATTIDIKGNSDLSIFLSNYGLSNAFARITLSNSSVTNLTMQYVSPIWNTFDLTNIKHLKNLSTLDISNNLGIKTLNPLLNVNRGNYSTVKFTNIGEIYEYNAFVIDNLASNTCSVTFTNMLGDTETKDTGNPSLLVNLGSIEDFVSEHIYLTNVIYNDDGTTTDVCWRVEQGNEINGQEINQGGDLETINNINEMNLRISPYYYCNQDFTYKGNDFIKYGLYKVIIDTNDDMLVTPLNIENGNITYQVELVNGVPSTDYDNISDDDPNLKPHDPHLTFSGEYSRTQTPTSTTGTIYNQDSSIVSNTVNYTLRFRYHVFGFKASRGNNTTKLNHYLSADTAQFTYTYNTNTNNTNTTIANYFVFLTQNEADFVVELRNNNFVNTTDVILDKYGITPNGTVITLGSNLPERNSTLANLYIYHISTQKFVTVYGMSDDPISKFDINRPRNNVTLDNESVVGYTIKNKDNNKYLAQVKLVSSGTNTPWDIGVIYFTDLYFTDTDLNNFCSEIGSNERYVRSYWRGITSATYELTNTITCAEKTPTLDVTMGKDKTATAYFNCVYIGNGRNGIQYKMYDTGTFLLISNQASTYGENAKFCFMTAEEKDRLEAWYQNPQEDITIGTSPQNLSYYYIYCPYTRRFISGGTTDTDGEIYKTVSNFSQAQLYYVHKDGNYNRYYVTADPLTNNTGFNAYGGIKDGAKFIALYHNDDNTTNVFQSTGAPYEITYSIKATSATYIAYQVDYTVTKVRAHILERDISKEYKFDKFYYLNEDIVIDGITYRAGNVIRFVCDAYYGIQYEADIEYYELTLTYYDDEDDRGSNHQFNINQFNTAEYIYYYLDNLLNVQAFEDGEIIYTKLPTGTFEKYNQSATYNNHENPTGITIPFPETKWIYTATSFDNVKTNLYLDDQGAQSAANATYNEGTTYYKQKYIVATVFADTFEELKPNLYVDTNGTKVANNATFNPSLTYYVVGYEKLNPTVLTTNLTETYERTNVSIEVPIFEYYKNGIYTDTNGTRVALNATYNPNATYYFLQSDGTYSTTRPKYYSGIVSDYVSLTLNATTFEYFKHNIYLDKNGTVVSGDAQYSSDIIYYQDAYVVSTFKNDVLNQYRSVLYKDEKGTTLDQEETFNPNITYYTNEFVAATVNNAQAFNNMKSRLYANQYGLPLDANATYDNTKTYYRKVFIVANPEPTGNLVEDWIQTKNQITRLYSHTKLTTNSNFITYESDYGKVYDDNNYPIIYKYTGEGSENIYADPTITVSYEPIRTGSVTLENFNSMKSMLYADQNGTPLANDAVYVPGMVYYVKTWITTANILYPNVSYVYNVGYYLTRRNDDTLEWNADEDGIDSNTAGTMDDIIDEANSHFNDLHYNEWYGKHYAYNGFTMQSTKEIFDENGNVLHGYDKGTVYRIVLNADNTAFVWQKVYNYYRKEGPTMVTEASTGVAKVGDTIWALSQCFGGFYTANKFYRVVNDDFTKTLNVIQFTDVIVNNTNNGYTDIQGQKIRYIWQSDYLGYAGTYEIIISAVERITNGDGTYTYTDNVRTYKIKFVGTVIR